VSIERASKRSIPCNCGSKVQDVVVPKSFSLPESILDKSKARFRRLQNSLAAQTLVIADLTLRQDLLAKTLSMSAQMDIIWATGRLELRSYVITRKILGYCF
jgi:hypothetical protein